MEESPQLGSPQLEAELAPEEDPLEATALRAVAGRHGAPLDRLKVAHAATGTYRYLGKKVRAYKAVNELDGAIHSVALDEDGREVDAAELQRRELEAREAIQRRLDARLAERLASAGRDELIEVAIWLKEPSYQGPARPAPRSTFSKAESAERFSQIDDRRGAFVKAVTDPFAAGLRARGFQVEANTHAPLVYATLSPEVIEELRASRDVERMYLPSVATPALLPERQSIFAHVPASRGFTGAGVSVGVIEVGGRINTSNPYLTQLFQDLSYSCLHAHATAVAGIIGSKHPTETGIAPGAALWIGGSCTGLSSQLTNRSTAAATWGARALNLSFGGLKGGVLTELDRYYDGMVLNQSRTVVPAAGNEGNGNFVNTPGSAYNVITAGAYNEATNAMWSDSCGVDPGSLFDDREKPEVAAPGVSVVSTTNASPWTSNTGSGTSYAAPMVTGTAALMMHRDPTLEHWPEAVRAILMATAMRNLEGAARLSELDGAGGIRADYADDVARGVNGDWGGIDYTCATPETKVLATASIPAGRSVRVAVSWNTDPNYTDYDTQPSADLDLRVKGPTNTTVATSTSYDNTYEIVGFTAPTTGVYSIEVEKVRCDLSPRYLGYAYFWR